MSCAADIRGWRSPHLKSVYFWLERVHEIISRVGLFLKITPCSLLEEFILALHGCLFAGRHWSLQKDVNYKFSRARFKTRKCRWATLLQQQFSMSVFCFGGLTETCSICMWLFWTASREKKKVDLWKVPDLYILPRQYCARRRGKRRRDAIYRIFLKICFQSLLNVVWWARWYAYVLTSKHHTNKHTLLRINCSFSDTSEFCVLWILLVLKIILRHTFHLTFIACACTGVYTATSQCP